MFGIDQWETKPASRRHRSAMQASVQDSRPKRIIDFERGSQINTPSIMAEDTGEAASIYGLITRISKAENLSDLLALLENGKSRSHESKIRDLSQERALRDTAIRLYRGHQCNSCRPRLQEGRPPGVGDQFPVTGERRRKCDINLME
jgi:hypothetical protein